MAEQYDNRTENLIGTLFICSDICKRNSERKWKAPTTLGGEGSWIFEVGQAPEQPGGLLEDLKESNVNVGSRDPTMSS